MQRTPRAVLAGTATATPQSAEGARGSERPAPPLFEADFLPCSYGFRPKRRTHDTVAEVLHRSFRRGDADTPRRLSWLQRKRLGNLRGLAAPGRQDRRGEPPALAGVRIDAAIVDPRRNHLHRSGAGQDLTALVSAVAYHQPAPIIALERPVARTPPTPQPLW
jgi:hypothetical protein